MKVFFDSRMLFMSGIGRYIQNILIHLPGLTRNLELVLAGNPVEISAFVDKTLHLGNVSVRKVNFRAPIYSIAEQLYGSMLLSRYKGQTDLFHFPHYNAPWIMPANSVVTVHDLIHFRFPEYYGGIKVKLAKRVLENAVKKASRVIVVSQATADDLAQMFPGVTPKVRVVHNGISKIFRPQPAANIDAFKREHGLRRYLLYVGTRKPHKNLGRLLRAYANLKMKFPDLQLVIVGKRFDVQDQVTHLIKQLRLSGVIELEQASDEDLVHLYCGAEALVFPSLYEGFGFPPMEALACGTPVVVSNTSSLPEVVGEVGVYIDPYDVEDITHGIYRVLVDGNLRQHLKEQGFLRAKDFTWEKSVQKTLEVYGEVMK